MGIIITITITMFHRVNTVYTHLSSCVDACSSVYWQRTEHTLKHMHIARNIAETFHSQIIHQPQATLTTATFGICYTAAHCIVIGPVCLCVFVGLLPR